MTRRKILHKPVLIDNDSVEYEDYLEDLSNDPMKNYAVSHQPIKRGNAYINNAHHLNLYKPELVASEIATRLESGEDSFEDIVDDVLINTGYNKAIRQREELIRWKTRILKEVKEINNRCIEISNEKKELKDRNKNLQETLQNIRNILRIPRIEGDSNNGEDTKQEAEGVSAKTCSIKV